MKKFGIVVLFLAIVLSAAACQRNNNGAPDDTAPPAGSPAVSPTGSPAASPTGANSNVDAQAVYKKNCIGCHAADLSGGVGPKLSDVGGRLSADEIGTVVTNGRGGMPSFKATLSQDEINSIAQWLSTQKG